MQRHWPHKVGAVLIYKPMPTEKEVIEELTFLKSIGFVCAQIFMAAYKSKQLKAIRKAADDLEMELHGLHAYFESDACPISDDATKRDAAFESIKVAVENATIIGDSGFSGPLFGSLMRNKPLALPTDNEQSRCIEFIAKVDGHVRNETGHPPMPVGWEALNRFEWNFPTSMDEAQLLFEKAGCPDGTGALHLADTCHTNWSGRTENVWPRYDGSVAAYHLSDFTRGLPETRAISQADIDTLAIMEEGRMVFIEAVGNDADPGIAAALGIRQLPHMSGRDVIKSWAAMIQPMIHSATGY